MEAKLWIPLLFALSVLIPVVWANSIKPLSPIAGTVGSELNITCDATITTGFEAVKLKKITRDGTNPRIVQLEPPNFDQPPTDKAKYQLTKTSLHGFYITIKDVVFEDAARYRCSLVVDDTIYQLTTVVTVRAPTIQMLNKIQAGQMTQIICDAEYQVPYDLSDATEKDRFPELSASIGGVWLEGGIPVRGEGKIQTTWNTTLGGADDQKSFICKVFTTMPPYEQTASKILNILFDVQNVNLSPEKETYTVGEEINCTADGNPAPDIKWIDITKNGIGTYIGTNLLILDTMMGKKQNWKCEATSSTGTKKEKTIEFAVAMPTEPPPAPNKASPTAAIAAGVTVPLVIIIAVVIVIIVVIMRKKKQKTDKPPPDDAEGTISSGPFTNPIHPEDDQHNKPNNKPTAYQSEKPSVPPHQKPYPNNPDGHNAGYQPSKYDEDLNTDMSAEMARRALTPLPMEEADYDIPYNDERGQPRLADIASYVAPPGGPPPGGLPPDQQYSVVHRPPPTPTDYPDMAAAHPGLQQVYNMPKPRVVPRPPADTTV